jgi:phytoene dehydrogenase-like protein
MTKAVVVGAGPNGLAAGIHLAQHGLHGLCGYHAAASALRWLGRRHGGLPGVYLCSQSTPPGATPVV